MTIGIILVGLSAILALMVVAMSPYGYGDDDQVITLEKDTCFNDEGVRLKVTVFGDQGEPNAELDEIAVTHYEYRQAGSFFTPALEEI